MQTTETLGDVRGTIFTLGLEYERARRAGDRAGMRRARRAFREADAEIPFDAGLNEVFSAGRASFGAGAD